MVACFGSFRSRRRKHFRSGHGELANAPVAQVKTYPARIHQHHDSKQLVQADLPMY
jgi:hypothetical protein